MSAFTDRMDRLIQNGFTAEQLNQNLITAYNVGELAGIDSGEILQGGNSFGIGILIGTLDNYVLNFQTGGVLKFQIEVDGTLNVQTLNYEALVLNDNDIPNKKYVDDKIGVSIVAINANTTLAYNTTYEVDATLGNIVLTLPTAISNSSKQISVRKVDNTANTITVQTIGGQTINGDATAIIQYQNTFITFNSNGANFFLS